MEVQKYGHAEYLAQFSATNKQLFDKPNFVELLGNTYQKSITWYVVTLKNEVLISFPVYHKNRNAELITHFFYQAILLEKELEEEYFQASWKMIIEQLKQDFDAIDFKFAPYVEDISPFLEAGFEPLKRHTSVIDLNIFPNYSENVRRSLKKAAKFPLSVAFHRYKAEVIEEQIVDMRKYGLGKRHVERFKQWFEALAKREETCVVELLEDGVRIGSALYLVDEANAYLIATMGGKEESGGQAYLYDQAFRHFKEKGLTKVDLLGANIPSVALYKSKLGAELQSYFMVSYRKHKLRAKLMRSTKDFAKRMLKSLPFINK